MYAVQTTTQLAVLLRSLRKSKGLTQARLGAVLGVSGARVSVIEQHPGAVSVAQLLDVLHVLGARMQIDGGGLTAPARDAVISRAGGEW